MSVPYQVAYWHEKRATRYAHALRGFRAAARARLDGDGDAAWEAALALDMRVFTVGDEADRYRGSYEAMRAEGWEP